MELWAVGTRHDRNHFPHRSYVSPGECLTNDCRIPRGELLLIKTSRTPHVKQSHVFDRILFHFVMLTYTKLGNLIRIRFKKYHIR